MANLQNLPRRKKPSFLSSLGNKVKSAFEYGMAAKGLFDMGKGIIKEYLLMDLQYIMV